MNLTRESRFGLSACVRPFSSPQKPELPKLCVTSLAPLQSDQRNQDFGQGFRALRVPPFQPLLGLFSQPFLARNPWVFEPGSHFHCGPDGVVVAFKLEKIKVLGSIPGRVFFFLRCWGLFSVLFSLFLVFSILFPSSFSVFLLSLFALCSLLWRVWWSL